MRTLAFALFFVGVALRADSKTWARRAETRLFVR